jgi:DMSO/TMAO reductase YedYZ heme-binding membrane subunit
MNTFLNLFRKYGSYLGFLALFIFFAPENFKNFGGIGWQILMFIMFLSPITKLFPRWTWLMRLMPLRRQLGIIAGALVLAHGAGAYMIGYEPFSYILDPQSYMFWGIL